MGPHLMLRYICFVFSSFVSIGISFARPSQGTLHTLTKRTPYDLEFPAGAVALAGASYMNWLADPSPTEPENDPFAEGTTRLWFVWVSRRGTPKPPHPAYARNRRLASRYFETLAAKIRRDALAEKRETGILTRVNPVPIDYSLDIGILEYQFSGWQWRDPEHPHYPMTYGMLHAIVSTSASMAGANRIIRMDGETDGQIDVYLYQPGFVQALMRLSFFALEQVHLEPADSQSAPLLAESSVGASLETQKWTPLIDEAPRPQGASPEAPWREAPPPDGASPFGPPVTNVLPGSRIQEADFRAGAISLSNWVDSVKAGSSGVSRPQRSKQRGGKGGVEPRR
ncbi:MAG: hypothetical protein M1833_001474 [Piccolia ochrophora]|nr:MAG: hypothetical protein M1833_001474 [Piccolia ochrophora]